MLRVGEEFECLRESSLGFFVELNCSDVIENGIGHCGIVEEECLGGRGSGYVESFGVRDEEKLRGSCSDCRRTVRPIEVGRNPIPEEIEESFRRGEGRLHGRNYFRELLVFFEQVLFVLRVFHETLFRFRFRHSRFPIESNYEFLFHESLQFLR